MKEGNKKILILENEPPLARVLNLKISSKGFDCEIFDRGGSALKELGTKEYGFVILNILLPDMDGFEFLKKVQNLKKRGSINKDLHVIVFSYLGQDSDVESVEELGVDRFFRKGKQQIMDIVNYIT